MMPSDLTNIVAAPAGYFVLDLHPYKENGEIKFQLEKRPIVLLAFRADEDHDAPVPVSLMGIEETFSPCLLPDGTVCAPYAGDAGEHFSFDTLDAWFAHEVAERMARLKARRAERESK